MLKTEIRLLTQNVGLTIKSHKYANFFLFSFSSEWYSKLKIGFVFFLLIIHLISISCMIKDI